METNRATVVKNESKTFDPYHKWLGIRDSLSPPNHYRLLGLELWETDEEVIRDAHSRQKNHVRSFWSGPYRELCERILNELQSARDTLLDPQLRRPYDRWLKLIVDQSNSESVPSGTPRQPFAVHGAANTPGSRSAVQEIRCSQCGAENLGSRKFCSGCGIALWEPCIECGVLCGPGDQHCGSCGINLVDVIQRRMQEFQIRFDEATGLHQQRNFSPARGILDELLQQTHPRLAARRSEAEQLAEQVRAEINHWEQSAATALDDANRLLQQGEFQNAAELLERLPPEFLTDSLRQQLVDIRSRQAETQVLWGEIQKSLIAKKIDGLLATVEKLLELQPNHVQAQSLQAKLQVLEAKKSESRCSELRKLAASEIERRNYSEAAALLEQIPPESRTPEIARLLDKTSLCAAEVDWLRSDLRDAVIYDEHLLPIAERLLKLQPQDALAKRAIEVLLKQSKLSRTERLKTTLAWPRFPAKSPGGYPLDIVRGFQHIEIDATQAAVIENPESYCVAVGLALQGLDKAALQTNLLPKEKTGLLGLLKARKRAPTKAWGIDWGRNGIKAVQLELRPKGERPVIVDSFSISWNENGGPAASDSSQFAETAMNSFLDQKSWAESAICVSISAQRTLMRFFEIPHLGQKKIAEVMQYEVQQQIPVPLETMAWDYQVLNSERPPGDSKGNKDDAVALFAMKLEEVQAQLKPFAERDIKIDVLQNDCAALYNFLAFEHFVPLSEQPTAQNTNPCVLAILDIGADSTNLVVSDSQSMFMRSIPLAGNQFIRAICKDGNLQWQQAEKLARNPTSASVVHRLYRAIEPPLNNLTAEIQKSIELYTSGENRRRVQKMLVIGGGSKLHGLLRHLSVGH